MKGFEITFRQQTIAIATQFDSGLFIYQRLGRFHVSVSGLEQNEGDNMISHIWIDSEMEIGETLELEIKEIQNGSKPIKKKVAFSDTSPLTESEYKDMLLEKLKTFRSLEKLLKKEGLI